MAMNTKKVLIGGLVAGVVVNIFDYLSYGLILGDAMRAEANAFKAGLGDQMMQMSGGQMAAYVVMDLIVGIILVWTYAAIRPRFGPGAKTAIYAAIPFWLFGSIVSSGFMQMGMMSSGTWWTLGIIWLVCLIVSTAAGAWLYTEDTATV
ncbi:MAG: hypothetical protein ABI681_10165 [Gemmatimonadales bacterium]